MFAKLKRKPVLIGILCVAIVALVAVFAIPAIAAAPLPWAARPAVNNNVTVVQGTIGAISSTSITINPTGGSTPVILTLDSSTNFNIRGNGWFAPASLVYRFIKT